MRLDLRVRLKTVDLVRETAWLALTENLGWGASLRDLKRSVLWRFEGGAPSREAFMSGLDAELERSSTFYNPNKESRAWLDPDALGEGEILDLEEARSAPDAAPAGRFRASLWVTDEGGQRADVLRRCAPRLAEAGLALESLRSGVLWDLTLGAEDAASARGFAAGLALTRSRREGLLANPHYQEVRLLALGEESS